MNEVDRIRELSRKKAGYNIKNKRVFEIYSNKELIGVCSSTPKVAHFLDVTVAEVLEVLHNGRHLIKGCFIIERMVK